MSTSLLLSLAVFVYFIFDQFEYNPVGRLSYVIIPIFCLINFLTTFTWRPLAFLSLLAIMIIGVGLGWYQARYAQIRLVNQPRAYFKDSQGVEQPIYRKVVKVRGGQHYLIGWLIALLVQFGLQILANHHLLSEREIFAQAKAEILADIMSVFRFASQGHTAWYLWSLTGIISATYTLRLAHRSPNIRQIVLGRHEDAGHIDQ